MYSRFRETFKKYPISKEVAKKMINKHLGFVTTSLRSRDAQWMDGMLGACGHLDQYLTRNDVLDYEHDVEEKGNFFLAPVSSYNKVDLENILNEFGTSIKNEFLKYNNVNQEDIKFMEKLSSRSKKLSSKKVEGNERAEITKEIYGKCKSLVFGYIRENIKENNINKMPKELGDEVVNFTMKNAT